MDDLVPGMDDLVPGTDDLVPGAFDPGRGRKLKGRKLCSGLFAKVGLFD